MTGGGEGRRSGGRSAEVRRTSSLERGDDREESPRGYSRSDSQARLGIGSWPGGGYAGASLRGTGGIGFGWGERMDWRGASWTLCELFGEIGEGPWSTIGLTSGGGPC